MIAIRGVADVNDSSPFVGKRRRLAPCGVAPVSQNKTACGCGAAGQRLFWWASLESNQAPTVYERNGGAQCAAHLDNLNEDMVK